jgi:hypothetical protein
MANDCWGPGDRPRHTHGGTDCGGGDDCPTAERGDLGMPTLGGKFPGRGGRTPVEYPRKVTINEHGMSIDYGELGNHIPAGTPEARVILRDLPTWLERFLLKNVGYARAQTGHDLGAKGIMPDINRKTSALLGRIWYGDQTTALQEDTVEVIDDLLGHLMLLRAKITEGLDD